MKVKLPFPKPKTNGVKDEETDVKWKVNTGPFLKQNKAKTIKLTKNDDVLSTIAKCMGNVEEIIEQLEGQVKFLDFKVLTKEVYLLKENLKQVEQQTIANKNRETEEKSEEVKNAEVLAALEKQTKKCYVKLEDISDLIEKLTNKNDDDDIVMDDQTQEQESNGHDNDQVQAQNVEVQNDESETEERDENRAQSVEVQDDENQVEDSDQDEQEQNVQDEDLMIPSECSDYSDQETDKKEESD